MAFITFTDGSANLPGCLSEGIRLLPCSYSLGDQHYSYDGDIDHFDGVSFYTDLKNGVPAHTTLLNTQLFLDHFEPVLKEGDDIIYIAMSSGISGTCNAARLAAEELMEKYPGRKIFIVDSLGCGLGSGLLSIKAKELSDAGKSAQEAFKILSEEVPKTCQYFTVDDLNFLKRTGRVSGTTAAIGSVLNIKPILYGDETGHIVSCSKVRGRKASIEAIAQKYAEKVENPENQIVCISHGNCPEDARVLADRVEELAKPKKLVICQHEPFSGTHVGPGMLALFFHGKER